MVLTAPPAAPNRAEPTTFSVRFDDWAAWFAEAVPEWEALSLMTGSGTFSNGSAASPSMTFTAGGAGLFSPGANLLGISRAGAEWGRINSAGSLLIGSSAAIAGLGVGGITQAKTDSHASFAALRTSNDTAGGFVYLAKSRGTTVTDYAIVQASDTVGGIQFRAAEGTTTVQSAQISAIVEGTPGAGDARAGLRLYTGNAPGTVGEALRADISQNVGIGGIAPTTRLHVNGPIRTASYTVATLPSASTVGQGAMAWVTDSSVTTFRSTVAGGGANKVQVISDGTNWLVH